MPLASDNYSRSVLGDVRKMSVFVRVRADTRPSFVTHFYKLSQMFLKRARKCYVTSAINVQFLTSPIYQ